MVGNYRKYTMVTMLTQVICEMAVLFQLLFISEFLTAAEGSLYINLYIFKT